MSWNDQDPQAIDVVLSGWLLIGGEKTHFEIDRLSNGIYRATVGNLFGSHEIAQGANLDRVIRLLYGRTVEASSMRPRATCSSAMACCSCGIGQSTRNRAMCPHAPPADEPAPDACYADCITPNVPQGHDTVLGYLARHHADVLDLIDHDQPWTTARDGWWLAHQAMRRGLEPIYVDAPPVLQRAGIFQVRAWPLDLLEKRWG